MDAFIGEIRAFPYTFVPEGWLACNGSQQPIQAYQALFAIIGSYYGQTDRKTYFTLPDLRGAVLIGSGQSFEGNIYSVGDDGGSESVFLTQSEMPKHNHTVMADLHATTAEKSLGTNMPGPTVFLSNAYNQKADGSVGNIFAYSATNPANTQLNLNTIGVTGSSDAHENRMPYQAIGYFICIQGQFPIKE